VSSRHDHHGAGSFTARKLTPHGEPFNLYPTSRVPRRARCLGRGMLIVGAAAHDRLARAERAADRRHRISRVGRIAERSCAVIRQLAPEAVIRIQIEFCPVGLRQRPVGGSPPSTPVFEPPSGVAATGSTAHHKDPHRRLRLEAIGDTLQPAVEPAPAQREEILGEIAVDRSRRAEIDLPGVGQGAVAMRPRAEDQPGRTALPPR